MFRENDNSHAQAELARAGMIAPNTLECLLLDAQFDDVVLAAPFRESSRMWKPGLPVNAR
jgi:hypothetical protein